MIEVCKSNVCTGCTLCISVCQHNAITMAKDNFGHLYSKIDQKKCVDCKLCQKYCPQLNTPIFQNPIKCYASWAKNKDEYLTSTSGGIASILSRYVVSRGGIVYACAMLSGVNVKHIRIEKEEDISLIKGSKYVQSNILEIIPKLKEDVNEGIYVLFIGTPCQVASIKNLFKNAPKNLITADLICHGVPSHHLFKKHIECVAPNTDRVIFRDNDGYVINCIDKDNNKLYRTVLFKERFRDVYLNAFFDGFSFRDSCYSCKYATQKRVSDITLGDFWGLGTKQSVDEMAEHPNGCSAILINTEKGGYLFEMIKPKTYAYERPVEECILGNEQLKHPKQKTVRIKVYRFMQKLVSLPKAYYLVNIDLMIRYKIHKLK